MQLDVFLAIVMLGTLLAYTLLAGADFGAGIWDLVSRGPRADAQRRALAHAIGPVWEANHVWLIFLIVLLFTCFPRAYAAVSIALFWPLHLVLLGIVLRGASFVFRAYGATTARVQAVWGQVFGAASALTPMLLGMCLGAVSSGRIQVRNGAITPASAGAWLMPVSWMIGVLALLLCAYLAAVYLAWESEGEVREDFRRRAVTTWFLAGAASVGTLLMTRVDAPRLWDRLTSFPAAALLVAGMCVAPASFLALQHRRYGMARWLGAAQVAMLVLGWAAAQWPFLIFPDITVRGAAAPASTLSFTALTLPFGLAAVIPSLWILFAVFKGRNPHGGSQGAP